LSGYTGTQTELLYCYGGAATTSTPTTSPGSTITATYPACEIPGQYFAAGGTPAKSLKLKMGGLLTATATVPTFQFALYLGTTNAFATTTTLALSTAVTPTAATNVVWTMDVDIVLRTLALGAGTTIGCIGIVTCSTLPSPFFVSMPATGAYSPLATYSADANAYLWPALILGAATASNTVTVEYMKLYGEN
jgi:hypothetical protein